MSGMKLKLKALALIDRDGPNGEWQIRINEAEVYRLLAMVTLMSPAMAEHAGRKSNGWDKALLKKLTRAKTKKARTKKGSS